MKIQGQEDVENSLAHANPKRTITHLIMAMAMAMAVLTRRACMQSSSKPG